jgi:5-methylcytosine-specific restriction protein B
VFVEAIRYAALLASAGDSDVNSALDQQIMQKILPRIHGSRKRVEPVLCSLGQYCYNLSWSPRTAGAALPTTFNPTEVTGSAALPISFDKVRRMTALVRANQFVSFTE